MKILILVPKQNFIFAACCHAQPHTHMRTSYGFAIPCWCSCSCSRLNAGHSSHMPLWLAGWPAGCDWIIFLLVSKQLPGLPLPPPEKNKQTNAGSRPRDFSRGASYDSLADVDALKAPRNALVGSSLTLRPESQLEDRPYSRLSVASNRTIGARSTTSLMMEGRAPKSIEKPVVIRMLRCVQVQRKWWKKKMKFKILKKEKRIFLLNYFIFGNLFLNQFLIWFLFEKKKNNNTFNHKNRK